MWSVRRIMVLTLCALAVQGSLLLAMNAAAVAAEEEECAAPVCAMICDDEELAMSDELKTMCACDMADDMSVQLTQWLERHAAALQHAKGDCQFMH